MKAPCKPAALTATLLALSGTAALAANAVTTAPVNVHANRTGTSTVIGTIQRSETIEATNFRNGWCAAAGGYVRSSKLRFARAGQHSRKLSREYEAYDCNVPLALPPYGYSPSFWGYGGRRYYDKFGNYTNYGQQP
jgi:hypothetical protein